MYIYKITNKVNNKIYIGQTINKIEDRFARHIQDAISGKLNTHFARAIRKYGPENFVYEKIDEANSQKELTEKEYY
jgi:group I intron endonuclease